MSAGPIVLRGVAVHNLKSIDLDIPHRKLIVLCGLSGSGKSSLALDTLYAEGQRRYIESFSAYTRQFLDRLEKPEAERIDGIPPAIAVTGRQHQPLEPLDRRHGHRSGRLPAAAVRQDRPRASAAAAASEVRRDTPQSVGRAAGRLAGRHAVHGRLRLARPRGRSLAAAAAALARRRFCPRDRRRAGRESGSTLAERQTEYSVRQYSVPGSRRQRLSSPDGSRAAYVVVDRLAAGGATEQRVRDSLETAFGKGQGKCFVFVEDWPPQTRRQPARRRARACTIDGRAVAAAGLQQQLGLRRLRHRVSPARAAAVQLQQPAGGLPEVRGFRQRHRRRHGPGRARSEQVDPRGGDRALEHAGLRPRTGRTAGPGRRLRPAGRRAVFAVDRSRSGS